MALSKHHPAQRLKHFKQSCFPESPSAMLPQDCGRYFKHLLASVIMQSTMLHSFDPHGPTVGHHNAFGRRQCSRK
jgi:hypothetical protein